MKHSERELIWHGEYPKACVERVRDDIAKELDDTLTHPSQLVFHTIFLGDDLDSCPSVLVWGESDCEAFHCEYGEVTVWETLKEGEERG